MSIVKWLTGNLTGGDVASTARLDAELTQLHSSVAPRIAAGTLRSLAVASTEPREGRTKVARLLAEALADNSRERLLLVDADGHRPRLHEAYQLDPTVGLAEVLRQEVTLSEAVRPTVRDNLDVLCAGTGSLTVGEAVTRANVQRMLADARETYEAVVLDTGPLLVAQEALVVCHSVQGVLLVVLAGETQGEVAAQGHRLLVRAQAPLLGVVVNDPRGEFVRHDR